MNHSVQSPLAQRQNVNTKKLVLLSVLCTIAYLCVFIFRIPVVMFLKYEPKDVIITMGAFLFGPIEAIIMSVVVSLIEMVTISSTGPIGMIMNIISTCAFSAVAALVYRKKRTLSGAAIGMVLGTICMTILMLLWNYLITPIYMLTPRETVAEMLVPVFLPFNLVKGGLNTVITLLIFQPVSAILKKSGFIPKEEQTEKRKHKILIIAGSLFVLISCIVAILLLNGVF